MSSAMLSAAKVSKKVRAPISASASASAAVARRMRMAVPWLATSGSFASSCLRIRDACGLGQQYLASAGARVGARQRGAHAAFPAFDVHELAAQFSHAAGSQTTEHAAHRGIFRDHVPVGRMRLDVRAFYRPVFRTQ